MFKFKCSSTIVREAMSATNTPLNLTLVTLFFLIVVVIIPSSFSLNFSFSTITPNDALFINCTGNASISSNGIQLTPSTYNLFETVGRATYINPLHLWDRASGNQADFTTHFSFVIKSMGSNDGRDGLTFFLAPVDSTTKQPSSDGKNLGIGESLQFVAVEFDTFTDVSFDPSYVNGHHVGIDVNAMESIITAPWFNNISVGSQNDAWISYNATSMTLRVDFTGFWNNGWTSGSLSNVVDLSKYLPEYVTFGLSAAAATGDLFETHSIISWNFSSSLETTTNVTGEDRTGLIVGLGVALPAFIVGVGLAIFCIWKNKYKKKGPVDEEEEPMDPDMDMEFEKGSGAKKFSYKELILATKNLAEEEKLGEGGFGGVYRGSLRESDSYIAVKRVSRGSKQGLKEYASEVKIISQLRHRNLVQLIGWCHQRGELLLVYEFLPNGSLDSHLFKSRSVLAWDVRYKIAQGLASALLYLHEGWERCVVHRDIKSSNIMLDSSFNMKLGDFGLARLVDHEKGSQTTVLAGTMGYMAPECVITGRASKETDVYSFGIVLLEIACGRRPVEHRCREKNQVVLLEWVWSLYGSGKLTDAADPNLSNEFDEGEMEQLMIVGLWCAHPDSSHRPSIRQAIHVLNFEVPLPVLPPTLPVPTYLEPSMSMSGLLSSTDSSNCYNKYSSSSLDRVTSSSEGNSTAFRRTV